MDVIQRAPDSEWRATEERFAVDIRQATSALHVEAERAGIVRDILRGKATRRAYAILLRNLWEAYRTLEAALADSASAPAIRHLARPEIYRTRAIAADLDALCGAGWAESLPLLDAGAVYAARVASAAKGGGGCLAAHAYVRYLGDLNGGQVLRRILGETLGLLPGELNFYEFAGIAEPREFAAHYRLALARTAIESGETEIALAEAAEAFRHNIALSVAVEAAAA